MKSSGHPDKKVKGVYRAFCVFICLCGVISILFLITMGLQEDPLAALGLIIPMVLMIYVFGPIAFTGYPPRGLRWILDKA